MNIIASADKNWGIGKEGDLLYNIPEDMKFFRETTTGKTIIMGRATLESLPKGKPLPKRDNIILSRTLGEVEGAVVCKTTEEVLEYIKELPGEDVFVIGGESIYRELLPYCDTAYITRVEAESEADRFLVNLDEDDAWEIAEESPVCLHENLEYRFVTYKRK